jgi:hypothetical protein
MLRLAAAVLLPYCLFAQSLVDYERQVHPILAAKCWSCHSQEKRSGGLSLATLADVLAAGRSGAAMKPGSAATSLLVRRVNGEVQPRMPIGAGSVMLFGGGIKRGFVYGKTADERPCTTIENPVPVEDLHATIYHALGIAPTQSFVVEKRPVYVTKDGKGKVIQELFA